MADAKFGWQLTEQVTRLRQRQTGPLILELDLTDGLPDGPVTDPLSAIMSRRKVRLPDVLEGLRRARPDDPGRGRSWSRWAAAGSGWPGCRSYARRSPRSASRASSRWRGPRPSASSRAAT